MDKIFHAIKEIQSYPINKEKKVIEWVQPPVLAFSALKMTRTSELFLLNSYASEFCFMLAKHALLVIETTFTIAIVDVKSHIISET